MPKQIITIDSILSGWSPSEYFSGKEQFLSSIGIDPDMPKDDSSYRPSGLIRPTAMSNLVNNLTGACLWLVNNNKNSYTYGYNSDGKVFYLDVPTSSYALTYLNGGAALIASSGNGMEYYNNYIYFAKNTDICRYGPLSSPSFNETYWTSTLSKTALTNPSYPGLLGVYLPNHPMYRHNANNCLYIGDVKANGVGCLHMINTIKVTYEGDTDSVAVPSAYDVLDFYYGWWPTCISSYNTMLAIGIIDGQSSTVRQKNAQVIFWSTIASDTSYNLAVELPDPYISSLKFINGILYAISGSITGGMRLSRYMGGRTFEEIAYLPEQNLPFPGAVDYIFNRIIWGTNTINPASSASVFSYGSRSKILAMGVQNILNTISPSTNPMVSALKYVDQKPKSKPIVASWSGAGPTYKIDIPATTYVSGSNIFRTEIYKLGISFDIKRIRIPVVGGMNTNKSFSVQAFFDDEANNSDVKTITNTTDYLAKYIDIRPISGWSGKNNFYLEIKFLGTALCVIGLPIIIELETKIND